jgi:aerobic C4-dicarboxylate transport protein
LPYSDGRRPVSRRNAPTAYSFNHDGTCLYFAAVSVFLRQATGTDLSWTAQLSLLLVLLLTFKGGTGVSGSAIAVLALVLSATHTIPVSSIALVLGVHSILSAAQLPAMSVKTKFDRDRLRTQLNAGYQQAA